MTEERTNAKQLPRVFYCKHLEGGLAKYENETVLLDNDALKKMIPSFAGKPVYVEHQKVDVEKLQEEADGYVSECFYNELDGWLWAKFIAVSDEAQQVIQNGWSVSNAYIPTETGSGGVHHNCPYDKSILNGIFTHLALVPNPRYEEAKILTPEEFKIYQDAKKTELKELHNSKEKRKPMLKLFRTKKEEVTNANEIDGSETVEIIHDDGSKHEVSITEMINAVKKNAEEEKKKEEEEKVNMEMEIEVEGEKMPLKELMNRYRNACKKNADEEEAKKKLEEKENAEAEDKKAGEEEKKNAKIFEELQNAHKKAPAKLVVETSHDKLARGKALYSFDSK